MLREKISHTRVAVRVEAARAEGNAAQQSLYRTECSGTKSLTARAGVVCTCVSHELDKSTSHPLQALHCIDCLLLCAVHDRYKRFGGQQTLNSVGTRIVRVSAPQHKSSAPQHKSSRAATAAVRCQLSLQSLSYDRAAKNKNSQSNSATAERAEGVTPTFESPSDGASRPSSPPVLSLALFPQLSSPKVRKRKDTKYFIKLRVFIGGGKQGRCECDRSSWLIFSFVS